MAKSKDAERNPRPPGLDEEEEEESKTARNAALAALALAIVLVVYLIAFTGGGYSVTAQFQNASQLVAGNQVEVAGVAVGTIDNVGLGTHGQADVKMTIDSDHSPLPRGTIATVRASSLSGIANRYVALTIPAGVPKGDTIPDGGTLPISDTISEVDLDQLFNTLDKKTIHHFKQVLAGFAASYDGVGKQANGGFKYLNPFLSTGRRVLAELTLDQRAFENLIVDSANLTGALAQVAPDISLLVHNTNLTFGALARQNVALAATVQKLPPFMRLFNTTSVNLRATLDDLDPLVAASKPVAKKLGPFFAQLRGVAQNAVPTIKSLDTVISRPGANNDLIDLTKLQVPLNQIASGPVIRNGATRRGAFPESVQALKDSLPQLAFFRPYVTAEGVSGWFDDFSTHSGTYDANGGIARLSTTFNAFSLSGAGLPNLLAPPLTGAQFLNALDTGNLQRCPGSNERNPGDNSTPFTDNGTLSCNPAEIPVGP